MNWIFDKENNRIITENDNVNIWYLDEYDCPNYIFEHIVYLHNSFEDKEIDNFLLYAPCTQDEREDMLYYINKYKNVQDK